MKNNLFFPLSLASEGSCTIGGNIATNAGGVGVLYYGNTRELVLGLEVVLPDGKIINNLQNLSSTNFMTSKVTLSGSEEKVSGTSKFELGDFLFSISKFHLPPTG